MKQLQATSKPLDKDGNPLDPKLFYVYISSGRVVSKGYDTMGTARAIAGDLRGKGIHDTGIATGADILTGNHLI